MQEPASPFDEDQTPAPAPARVRRPWWRWNVLTLFAALFVMVWLRYLLALSPGLTWTLVLTIGLAWASGPMTIVPTRFTTMPQRPSGAEADGDAAAYYRHRRWKARLLGFFTGFGFLLIGLAFLHLVSLVVVILGQVGYGGIGPRWRGMGFGWFSLLQMLAQPLIEMLGAAMLIVLCEIAYRIDLIVNDREQ